MGKRAGASKQALQYSIQISQEIVHQMHTPLVISQIGLKLEKYSDLILSNFHSYHLESSLLDASCHLRSVTSLTPPGREKPTSHGDQCQGALRCQTWEQKSHLKPYCVTAALVDARQILAESVQHFPNLQLAESWFLEATMQQEQRRQYCGAEQLRCSKLQFQPPVTLQKCCHMVTLHMKEAAEHPLLYHGATT